MQSIAPGTYVVRAEAGGFRPLERRVIASGTGLIALDLRLDIAIAEAVMVFGSADDVARQMDRPSDTGSRLGLTARELPASLEMIPQDLMRARGQRTVGEAIESAIGVTVGDSPGNPANFSMRGFTNNQVSVLHDGLRVGPPSMVSRPVDVWNLERVDVLKGPGSALFGEGAVGGAVNYIFRRPDRGPQRSEGELSYGGFNTVRLGLGAGGPLGNRGVHYRVDYSLNDTDGFIEGTPSRLQSLTSAVAWDASARLNLQVSFDLLDDSIRPYWGTPLVPGAFAADPIDGVVRTSTGATLDRRMSRVNYNVGDNVMDSTTHWTRVKAQWRAARATVRNELYYLSADREWLNSETYAFNPQTRFVDRDRFYVAHDQSITGNRIDVQLDRPVGGFANRFLAGFDVNRLDFFRPSYFADGDSVDPFAPVPGVFGPLTPANQTADITNAAFFVEDSLAVQSRLKLSAGLRAERIDLDRQLFNSAGVLNTGASFSRAFTPVTWKAGVVYDVAPHAAIYGHVATAADPVNTNLFIVRSRENFDLATGFEVEIGTKQRLPRSFGDWTAAYYRIARENILTQTSLTTADPVGRQSSHGLELSAALRPAPRWQLQAHAAFVSARFDDFDEPDGGRLVSRAGTARSTFPTLSWARPAAIGSACVGPSTSGSRIGTSASVSRPPTTRSRCSPTMWWMPSPRGPISVPASRFASAICSTRTTPCGETTSTRRRCCSVRRARRRSASASDSERIGEACRCTDESRRREVDPNRRGHSPVHRARVVRVLRDVVRDGHRDAVRAVSGLVRRRPVCLSRPDRARHEPGHASGSSVATRGRDLAAPTHLAQRTTDLPRSSR